LNHQGQLPPGHSDHRAAKGSHRSAGEELLSLEASLLGLVGVQAGQGQVAGGRHCE
jgi:hypothetical protein